VLDGTVTGRNMQRHRHQEFIRFLNELERDIPPGKVVHVIPRLRGDKLWTIMPPINTKRSAPGSNAIRAGRSTPVFTGACFTPTSSSWLNAVEGFFAKLTRRRLKRGVFHSLVDLQAAINRFIAEHNREPKPFIWKADPDKIIAARNRGFQTLESIH
jgi:transposase